MIIFKKAALKPILTNQTDQSPFGYVAGCLISALYMTFLSGMLGTSALAADLSLEKRATIERLRSPAWLERQGKRTPLVAGSVVELEDKILTGTNARLLLRLPEGSAVVLGENSRFVIERLSLQKKQETNFFASTMQLLAGTLRYVTATTEKLNAKNRDVQIRTVTATIGIRGTVLWAQATPEKELVCLFNGKIDIARPNEALAVLSEPNAFWIAPSGKPALPIGIANTEQLASFANQVSMPEGSGLSHSEGKWAVVAGSFSLRDPAKLLLANLQEHGYPAQIEILPATPKKRLNFKVIIPGFDSHEDALTMSKKIAQVTGLRLRIETKLK